MFDLLYYSFSNKSWKDCFLIALLFSLWISVFALFPFYFASYMILEIEYNIHNPWLTWGLSYGLSLLFMMMVHGIASCFSRENF